MKPHNHQQMARFERVWDAAGGDFKLKSALADYWCDDGDGDMLIMKLLNHRTRAWKNQAPIYTISPKDWARKLEYYRHSCAYCGRTGLALTMDHVVPLVRGGWHGIGNIVPCCHKCNANKGGHYVVEWRYKGKRKPVRA